MTAKEESAEKQKKGIVFTKTDDFRSEYANNSLLQVSNWDLKIIFGELDQSKGPNDVIQKVAITLPWPQAKVLSYFLTLNLITHEAVNQREVIPSGIIPPLPKEAPPGVTAEAFRKAREFYDKFIAENPEASPK